MKPLKVGIIGLGTVASGVVSVLSKNRDEIKRRLGTTIEIEMVYVRSLERENPFNLNLTTNIDDILHNDEIEMVIELIGGIHPAFEYIKSALINKKGVITANKELIALHGNELMQIAAENDTPLRFEAAVAGGIPILKTLREGLAANRISSVAGIINGTSNYILTEMTEKGSSFDECLKEAQALGYAEQDPTFDIKGIDAAHKLTILASIAFGIPLSFEQLTIEGIDQLSAEDIALAKEYGYTIKHLGIAKREEDGLELRVHPTMIPHNHILADVNGVMNGVFVHCNAVGDIFNYGAGAGGEATASAVIADLMDLYHAKGSANLSPALGFQFEAIKTEKIVGKDQFHAQYFIRIADENRLSIEEMQSIAKNANIQIEELSRSKATSELILITQKTVEKEIENLLNDGMLKASIKNVSYIRIETFKEA